MSHIPNPNDRADTILPRDIVAERLAISSHTLVRYEAMGLLHVIRHGSVEGYGPAEIHRAWSILSLQRDLGINLAGVEAVLKLRAHLQEIHNRLAELAGPLRDVLEESAEHEGP